MNTKPLLILSALALGLSPAAVSAQTDGAMNGMDMGGMKMTQKPPSPMLSVTATINPAIPKSGDNRLDLMVSDSAGKPVTGLHLTGSVAMTSMDMGTTHPAFTEAGSGHYKATVIFSMDGPWRVVIQDNGSKLAVLNFLPGSKTPWKPPQIKATGVSSLSPAPDTKAPDTKAMAGVDMSGGKADAKSDKKPDPMGGMNMGGNTSSEGKPGDMAGMKMDASSGQDKATKTGDISGENAMPGMEMGGAGMSGMTTGIADMKTATIPRLQEKGTYTATGDEDWKKQTGFGHNAGMVGMMVQMMVGGSGMEGMKMAPMNMKFDEQNYAKPAGDEAAGDMAGMDMGGKKDAMPGMKMPAAASSATITAALSAPKSGDNALQIAVTDAQGKPVTGAKITTSVAMTSMDMGTTHPTVKELGGGKYAASVNFGMAGPWRVTVNVSAPGQKPALKSFDFMAK